MPTYEYECTQCGKPFEFFQSISEPPKEKCEECGGKLTKLLSAGSGLIFKGSGFYITDYKNKGGGEGKSESSGESKASNPEAKGSTDNKPGSETKKSESKPAESSSSSKASTTTSSTKTDS